MFANTPQRTKWKIYFLTLNFQEFCRKWGNIASFKKWYPINFNLNKDKVDIFFFFLLKSFGFYFKVNWAFMQTETIEEITKI